MRRLLPVTLVCFILSGCLSPLPKNTNPNIPLSADLSETPFFPQTEFHCGPAALATLMGAEGASVSPAALSEHLFIPSVEGSLQVEMLAASRRQGYIPVRLSIEIQSLFDTVALGKPVLLLQNLATPGYPRWHYSVLVGYDISSNKLILRSGAKQRKVMSLRSFLRTWNWGQRWAIVLLQPGEMVETLSQQDYFEALVDIGQTDNLELAMLAYSGALSHWPDSEFLWTGVGSTAFQTGDLVESENAFRQLLKFHPDSVSGRNNLANVLLAQGCSSQALGQVEKAEGLLMQDQRFASKVLQTKNEIAISISEKGIVECDRGDI